MKDLKAICRAGSRVPRLLSIKVSATGSKDTVCWWQGSICGVTNRVLCVTHDSMVVVITPLTTVMKDQVILPMLNE